MSTNLFLSLSLSGLLSMQLGFLFVVVMADKILFRKLEFEQQTSTTDASSVNFFDATSIYALNHARIELS